MAVALEENFRCRLCRNRLFSHDNLDPKHIVKAKCSSWYLRDDVLVPWVLDLVNEGGWTEGKLYCPKCNARVGGFDFLHVVPCACEEDVLPAIWCVKSKVDHMQNSLIIAQHSSADGGDNTSNVKRSTVNSNVDSNVNPTLGQDNTDSGSSDAGKYNVQHRTETVVTECLLDTKASANGDVECSEIQQRSGKSHGYQHCSPETWGVCNPSINAHICKQHQCKSSHCHISTFGRGNHLGTKVTGQNFAGAENLTLYQGSISNHCLGDCCFFECCSHYRPDFYGIGKCHAAPEACKMHECCNGTICANSMCNCVRINEDTSEFPVSVQIFSGKDCTHAHCGGKKEASNLCEHKYTSLPCQERSIDYTGVGLGSNVNISKCCAGSLCCCSTHLHTLMNHGHCSLRNNSFSDTFCHEKQGAFEADIYEDFAEMRRHITSCYPTTYSMNNWEYRPKVFHRDRVSNRKRLQRIPRVKRGIVSRKRLSRRLSAASQQADDENSVGFVEREPKSLKNGKVKSSSGSTSVSANLNRFASLSCVDKRDSRHISDSEDLSDSDVPDSFKCSVCLEMLFEPHKTPCEHVFCDPCLRHLNISSNRRPMCPLCRRRVDNVSPHTELDDTLKVTYPALYRKRYKEERKRRHRKWPLPSPSSTRFSALPRDEDDQILPLARLLRNITTIAIMLSILLGYLFHNRNNAFRRNGRRIFLIMGGTLSIIFVVIIGTLLIVYAFDFVKFALAIVLCYAVLMKILVRVIFD